MHWSVLIAAVWILLVCATPAFAYVDPGSGGMILQLLLGGAAGVVVLVRLYWRRFLQLVGLRKADADDEQ